MSYACEDSFVPASSFCKFCGTIQCPLTNPNIDSCPLNEDEKDEIQQTSLIAGLTFFG